MMPLLLLNTTTVEGGRRALISPLPVRPREFPDTVDVRAAIGRPLSNGAAAHLSARFMYVSPAGTVRTPDGNVAGHLVDGGYFENSGATTLADALVAAARGRARNGPCRVHPAGDRRHRERSLRARRRPTSTRPRSTPRARSRGSSNPARPP